MPIAGPPTAATTGFFIVGSARKRCAAGDSSPAARGFRKSARSLPALKQSRVPCSSTARTLPSASAEVSAAPSWRYISAVKAFFFSGRSSARRATPSAVSTRTKLVVFHLLPQRQLRELAGRRVRQLLYEYDVVGHPPLGDLAFVEAQQIVLAHFLSGLLHRDNDRPLVPLRMLDADHRRLGDRRMRNRDVLEVDRANPLAAGLDHVLRAVGDLDVAVRIAGADIAGREPALLQRIAALPLEQALNHPGAAYLQDAEGLAVPRQFATILVDDADVDAEEHATLLVLQLEAVFRAPLAVLRLEGGDGAERAHLGHAPGMQHLHAEVLLEGADHGRRARRAADDDALQRREAQLLLLHVIEEAEPDRRHAGAHRHFLALEELVQALAVEVLRREDELRAHQRACIRQSPGVDMEHRHHWQDHVSCREI